MKKNKQIKSSFSALNVIAFTLFLVFLLAYVSIKIEQVKTGYSISENKKIEDSLLKQKQTYRAELMKLKSPDRLEISAMKMGFKIPTYEDVVFVERATLVGKRR